MGKEFGEINLSGAVFRETDLSRARMYGVLLIDADIDGAINGLRVNGVEVMPLIEAELDRLHPERVKLRPTTPSQVREACEAVDAIWAPTMARARSLPEATLHESVNDEWSFVQTLRHLVMVTDAWFGHAVLGEPFSFHPMGLPASFITDASSYGIDSSAKPSLEEVAAVRVQRLAQLKAFAQTVTQEELDREYATTAVPGWPPPGRRTATYCLNVIFNEEWAHHQFAIRDLLKIQG